MTKDPISLAAPIGIHVARADVNFHNCSITVISTSGCDEGAYYPAHDVNFYGDTSVTALRDFCNKVLEARKEYKQ